MFRNGILLKSILFQIGQNPKYAKDVDSGYFGSYLKFGNQITILVILKLVHKLLKSAGCLRCDFVVQTAYWV